MKYTVHQDTVTWMRVTHEVEVFDVEGLSEDEIQALIQKELSGENTELRIIDKRIKIVDSTIPVEEGLVVGKADEFEFKRHLELTMDDYVRRYVKAGARGHFAQHLGDVWTRAGNSNRAKLEASFPDIFTIPKELQ